eukprot:353102-Chlamydomonas_euryale.AAC.2
MNSIWTSKSKCSHKRFKTTRQPQQSGANGPKHLSAPNCRQHGEAAHAQAPSVALEWARRSGKWPRACSLLYWRGRYVVVTCFAVSGPRGWCGRRAVLACFPLTRRECAACQESPESMPQHVF